MKILREKTPEFWEQAWQEAHKYSLHARKRRELDQLDYWNSMAKFFANTAKIDVGNLMSDVRDTLVTGSLLLPSKTSATCLCTSYIDIWMSKAGCQRYPGNGISVNLHLRQFSNLSS